MTGTANNPPTDDVLSRREFIKVVLASATVTTAFGMGGITYINRIEPNWIEIAAVTLRLPRLPAAFSGYRLVQFSDIHMGTWMTRAHLEHIVSLINEQQPDLIALTGDFVTVEPLAVWAGELVPPLSTLSARDGAVAVLGNHDHWTNHNVIREVIRDSGLIDLNNRVHTLEREGALLHIAGVDDVWEGFADLDSVLAQTPNEGAAILLAHEPDFADTSAASGRFDLQISGHSHGGQVVLPFIGPPRLPRYGKKYPLGRYQVGDMIQYTNRGVGMVGPFVRFNCRPEITVFTLKSGLV